MPQDLQYLSPNAHSEFLKCIVKSNRNSLASKMSDALAISLRCDGLVDRTQIDKIHLMARPYQKTEKKTISFLAQESQKKEEHKGFTMLYLRHVRRP